MNVDNADEQVLPAQELLTKTSKPLRMECTCIYIYITKTAASSERFKYA
jgi:hypothetical protein